MSNCSDHKTTFRTRTAISAQLSKTPGNFYRLRGFRAQEYQLNDKHMLRYLTYPSIVSQPASYQTKYIHNA